jgi:2-(1,2-epoxy-1,2-dihydrophenyl)acetyl-CoA isomerase
MEYQYIRFEVANHLATITLNRPDRLNALSIALLLEMRHALKHINATRDIRALLITGEGRAFCTGADLGDTNPPVTLNPEDPDEKLRDYYTPVFMQLMDLKIPTIAAVNGPCAGAGMSMAMTCDIVFAARSAYFLQAFINIGLVPDTGSTWLLTQAIGPARARALMMLAERLPAETAAEWGVIWKCLDDDKMLPEAKAAAERLANGPTVTYGYMRKLMKVVHQNSQREQLLLEHEYQSMVRLTHDTKEARAAFVEKRKPNFTGD